VHPQPGIAPDAAEFGDRFIYAPLRVRFNSVATGFFAPFMSVAFIGAMILWAVDSISGNVSLWLFAIPGLPALIVAAWAMWRGARVRLVVSRAGVLIDNTWRSYEVSWSEVDGVGIRYATSPFPTPVLWFRLIVHSPVVAQATPGRRSVRQEFLGKVLSYAPPSVERLEDALAKDWLGSDSAVSWRLRTWWVTRHPNGFLARWLDRFGA
jgi:hypothetical protein